MNDNQQADGPELPTPPRLDEYEEWLRALLASDNPGTFAPSIVRDLFAEVDRLRQIIREYVAEVESGEKFDALVSAVPGLTSDDGVYGAAGEPRFIAGEWRASRGLTDGTWRAPQR